MFNFYLLECTYYVYLGIEYQSGKKEFFKMEISQLAAIISRLDGMIKEQSDEVQSRRFEKDGRELGVISYDKETDTFILEELTDKQKFEFDNIDLAAMEIYDLLND